MQVQALAEKLSKFTKINISYFIGGTLVKDDYNTIEDKKTHLAVCTPGRLKDLLKKYKDLLF